MKIPKKVLNFLDKNKIKYNLLKHRTVYTAYDTAQTLRRKLNEITKTLLVKVDKNYLLVVLPAQLKLDFAKLKKFLKAKKVELPKENVMKKLLKITPGAITPFGQLYKNLPVYFDASLTRAKKLIVQAGSFTESLEMKAKDFLKASGGTKGNFGKKK